MQARWNLSVSNAQFYPIHVCRPTLSGLHAGWELEGCDPSMKIDVPVRRDVLIDVPEGAVVRRIDGHTAVVTPAVSAIERSAGL
jgi:hypothetical protein